MTNETIQLNQANSAAAPVAATLLFVDDEQNILSSLKRLFRPLGYTIHIANGGVEGLSLLEKEHVDVVVSDMRMPEMDGAQFLELVATRWPHTVRILLTGYADIGSTVEAVNKGGIWKYVSKPWDDNYLKQCVQDALERKFLLDEKHRLEKLTQKQNDELRELNTGLEAKVAARTSEIQQMMDQLDLTHETLKISYTLSVKVFASLIEMREQMGRGHTRRVADVAQRIATTLGLSEPEKQDLMYAALLHDIGKMGLPDKGCTPSMGMDLWGESPLSEDSTLTMLLTPITTSRRQGQCCEVLSKGSPSAKRRADEQTTAWMPEVEQCRSNCRNRIQG